MKAREIAAGNDVPLQRGPHRCAVICPIRIRLIARGDVENAHRERPYLHPTERTTEGRCDREDKHSSLPSNAWKKSNGS